MLKGQLVIHFVGCDKLVPNDVRCSPLDQHLLGNLFVIRIDRPEIDDLCLGIENTNGVSQDKNGFLTCGIIGEVLPKNLYIDRKGSNSRFGIYCDYQIGGFARRKIGLFKNITCTTARVAHFRYLLRSMSGRPSAAITSSADL